MLASGLNAQSIENKTKQTHNNLFYETLVLHSFMLNSWGKNWLPAWQLRGTTPQTASRAKLPKTTGAPRLKALGVALRPDGPQQRVRETGLEFRENAMSLPCPPLLVGDTGTPLQTAVAMSPGPAGPPPATTAPTPRRPAACADVSPPECSWETGPPLSHPAFTPGMEALSWAGHLEEYQGSHRPREEGWDGKPPGLSPPLLRQDVSPWSVSFTQRERHRSRARWLHCSIRPDT